ncbi:MAG: hypothetical protein JSR77_11745 [Planctomycetes bacterium]|nr:hypothetical protein [Planctomycetota bacterium]
MTRTFVLFAGLAISSAALADLVSFDGMTAQPSTSWSVPSGGGSTTSTGNRFLGVPITLAGSNTTITGFDTTMLNNTGASLALQAGWQVALNYWIYNTWTPSATTAPAFANLAGNGSVAFNIGSAGLTLGSNSFLFFAQNASPGPGQVPPVGTLPGVQINPVTVSSTGPIGIVLNWTVNRADGAGFVLLGGLTQVLVGGATAVAPVVGTNNFSAPNLGYYRSASGEANGNFAGSSSRQIGANSDLMVRVYTTPTPGSLAVLGLGGLVVGRRRR